MLALCFCFSCLVLRDSCNGFCIRHSESSKNRARQGKKSNNKALDYGCIINGSARKSYLKTLDPSHIGIQGNEKVDQQAKTSLSLEPTSFKIPFSNFKPSINKYILDEWQTSWNNRIGNKLLEIKATNGEDQSVARNIRKEVVLARLRLGHTRVTHSY